MAKKRTFLLDQGGKSPAGKMGLFACEKSQSKRRIPFTLRAFGFSHIRKKLYHSALVSIVDVHRCNCVSLVWLMQLLQLVYLTQASVVAVVCCTWCRLVQLMFFGKCCLVGVICCRWCSWSSFDVACRGWRSLVCQLQQLYFTEICHGDSTR